MKSLLFIFFFPLTATAQYSIKGKVVNRNTKQHIAYATVSLMKQNIGVNATEEGNFELSSQVNYQNDTLIISSVGFQTLHIATGKLPSDMQYKMEEKQTVLKEIIITSKFDSAINLNEFSNCGIHAYTSSGQMEQMAMQFEAPKENTLLREIDICKRSGKAIFRVRIYEMDSLSGGPGQDLTESVIEINSSGRHIHIDLGKKGILLAQKDFFISIAWLIIPYNKTVEHYKKDGKKTDYITYEPYIFFKEKKMTDNNPTAWIKMYNGKWRKEFRDKIRLLISAKLNYN